MARGGYSLYRMWVFLFAVIGILLIFEDGQLAWFWFPGQFTAVKGHLEVIILYGVILVLTIAFARIERVRVTIAKRGDGRPVAAVFASALAGVLILDFLHTGSSGSSGLIDGALTVFQYLVVVAFVEEFAFRGYIQGKLGQYVSVDRTLAGLPIAVIFSAAFFAVMHALVDVLSSPSLVIGGLFVQFFAGLVYGWIYYRSGALIIPILSHGFFDLGGSLLANGSEIYTTAPILSLTLYGAEFIVPILICSVAFANRNAQTNRAL